MTRDRIKSLIENIIMEYIEVGCDGEILSTREASEEIMKLWDQGFVYEIRNTD